MVVEFSSIDVEKVPESLYKSEFRTNYGPGDKCATDIKASWNQAGFHCLTDESGSYMGSPCVAYSHQSHWWNVLLVSKSQCQCGSTASTLILPTSKNVLDRVGGSRNVERHPPISLIHSSISFGPFQICSPESISKHMDVWTWPCEFPTHQIELPYNFSRSIYNMKPPKRCVLLRKASTRFSFSSSYVLCAAQ